MARVSTFFFFGYPIFCELGEIVEKLSNNCDAKGWGLGRCLTVQGIGRGWRTNITKCTSREQLSAIRDRAAEISSDRAKRASEDGQN